MVLGVELLLRPLLSLSTRTLTRHYCPGIHRHLFAAQVDNNGRVTAETNTTAGDAASFDTDLPPDALVQQPLVVLSETGEAE